MLSQAALPRAQVFAAAALFSTGGAVIKGCDIGGWEIAALRSGIAAVALLVMIPSARRGWDHRTLIVAAAYGATMVLFVLGNRLTTAAHTIFLQGTAPLYVLVLAPLLLGERPRRREIGVMPVLAVGLILLLIGAEDASATAPDPFRGNLAGAAAGMTYGMTLTGLRWLERRGGSSIAAVAAGNLLACLFALPFAWPVGAGGAYDWFAVSYLGIIQIGVAYVCLTAGVRRVNALEVSLLLIAEPVLSPLWAWFFHGESPGPLAVLGGVLILGATVALALLEARAQRRS